MTLEELRSKAFFQNTIDIWIMLCNENKLNAYDIDKYIKFVNYLDNKNIKMQRFPLCIKESGGMFDRGMEKTKFLDELSKIDSKNAAAYTIKLTSENMTVIRNFIAR